MPQIKSISGPQMLHAVQQASADLASGSNFRISLFDSYDLCKLDGKQLVEEFGISAEIAAQVVAGLNRGDLSELSKAIGINLVVDKNLRTSLVPNAGIIRSAGILADSPIIPDHPDQIVEAIRQMRSN